MAELNYGPTVVYSDQILGCGAYGEVCRAKYGQLPCAAKALHKKFFDYNDPGEENFLRKFERECKFLDDIKHPNIIQYLGTSTEKSGRPVLLMEMMDESLTTFLGKRKQTRSGPPPYSLQVSICCDISLALSYLHFNNIIHRDLSSNNVLLLGIRAKVADFGVSTLFDKNLKYLTACPGNMVYMPPEALFDPPVYSEKLDCFSMGVITMQIATLNYPDPSSFLVESAGCIKKVPETERRKSDIELVPFDHPLLQMVLNCLRDKEERPSAQELCEELVARKGVYEEEEKSNENAGEVEETSADGIDRDSVFQSVLLELEEKTQLLNALQRDASERETSNMGTPDVSTREGAITENVPAGGEGEVSDEIWNNISITGWVDEPAPYSLSTYDGMAVFDATNSKAYFLREFNLYLYKAGVWSQLIDVNYRYCGLALVNRMLTTICGRNGLGYSRLLYTLTGSSKSDMTWNEYFERIPTGTGRESPACVSTSTHLIVLGGEREGSVFHCSNVLDLRSNQWLQATNIPDLRIPQVVIGKDILYLSSYEHNSLYTCRIEDLLASTTGTDTENTSLWRKLKNCPTYSGSSIVAFRGGLLAVGGEDEDKKVTKEVHFYKKDTDSWNKIGELPTLRKFALFGVLPENRIMCVGGQYDTGSNIATVNIGQMEHARGWCVVM